MQFLQASAAEAAKFEPPMRAAVLLVVGYTYEGADRDDKAREALQAAYATISEFKGEDRQYLGGLPGDIVIETTRNAPETVEQALPADESLRNTALRFIVEHDVQVRQFDHALELLGQMGGDDSLPYAAKAIMMGLPPKRKADAARAFSTVLTSYRRAGYTYPFGLVGDFPELIVRFWRDLPPPLVLEAVEEVLAQSKKNKSSDQIRATTRDRSGMHFVVFASSYQFRIFQFLPILERLDPARAESLRKENQETARMLERYPLEQESLDPELRNAARKPDEPRVSYSIGMPAGQTAAQVQTGRTLDGIVELSSSDPQRALAQANAITEPMLRLSALISLAQSTQDTQPEFAGAVAKKAIALFDDLKTAHWLNMVMAADVLLSVGDKDSARDALKAGAMAVQRIYEDDVNPEDPNKYVKLYWPSTRAWRQLIEKAAEVSPELAAESVKDIPDEEIKALERVILAGIWLEIPPWSGTSPMISNMKSRRTR